jgi:type II secretory pathway pseudopilin PulG
MDRARAILRNRGATRFEVAVCAGVFGVIVAVMLHYMQRYQAEAERATVRTQVAMMRSALLSEVLAANARGQRGSLQALVGSNPVALLRTLPLNYRGEFDQPDRSQIGPGHWYFDRKQQILVYLFNGNIPFFGSMPKAWSFRVSSLCLPTNNAKPPGTTGIETGVALYQVDG